MQKNLRQELEKRKIEIESWSEKILYVKDSDRIIAIAHISDYTEVDCINNEVVERVYSLQNVENQTIKLFDKYPMQKILWDVYIIFVLMDKEKFVDKEQMFILQRDKKYSKKYLLQGEDTGELSDQILKLLYPYHYIDKVMNKIQYEVSDEDNCNIICDSEGKGKEYVKMFNIKCCQDILDFLDKVNSDEYGENTDENRQC